MGFNFNPEFRDHKTKNTLGFCIFVMACSLMLPCNERSAERFWVAVGNITPWFTVTIASKKTKDERWCFVTPERVETTLLCDQQQPYEAILPGQHDSSIDIQIVMYSHHTDWLHENFRFMGMCIVNVFKQTKKMRYTMIFITINALHVSGDSSAHHQELKTVYTASGICRAFSASYCYCDWVGTGLCVHTQTSSNSLDKHPMLCIEFWAPDDGRTNRLKHVEHL